MNSAQEIYTVRCPDIIDVESQNDSDNYEPETPQYRTNLTHFIDDITSTTSSIVNDSTEGSTIDYDIVSATNLPRLPQQNSNICIKESSDILIGSKTHFNGNVVIQNYIAGNESQDVIVENRDTGELGTPRCVEEQSLHRWCCLLRSYCPCKSKWVFIVMCVSSVLGGIAIAVYFLHLHFPQQVVAILCWLMGVHILVGTLLLVAVKYIPKESAKDVDDDLHLFENENSDCDEGIAFEVGVLDLLEFGGPNLMRNGDMVYKSSHLLDLGVVSYGVETCKLEGSCIQSSDPAADPHTLIIDTVNKWKFWCSCKAGNGGKCKHLYAAILHIHTVKNLGMVTCTSRKKSWGKVAKEVAETILQPELLVNLPEIKRDRQEYYMSSEEHECFGQIYFSDPKSAVAKFLERHKNAEQSKELERLKNAEQSKELHIESSITCASDSSIMVVEEANILREFMKNLFRTTDFRLRKFFLDLPHVYVNFYNKRICLTFDEAVKLSVEIRDQKSALWLFERKLRITASECYKLHTASKYENTVWSSKIATYFKPKPNLKSLEIGSREEIKGLMLYEEKTQKKVIRIGLVVHPTLPWLGCSPDGFILETKTLIEIKTLLNDRNNSFHLALSDVKYLFFTNGRYTLRKKHLYYGHIQLNMHLLCARTADMVIHNYKSQEIEIIHVDYDEEFCSELITSLQSVYFSHV